MALSRKMGTPPTLNMLAGGAVAAGMGAFLLSKENRRLFCGRLKIFLELFKIQLGTFRAGRVDGDSLGDFMAVNLDVFRFLKLMYQFRNDELLGDVLSRPPPHLAHMMALAEKKSATEAGASGGGGMGEPVIVIKDLVLLGGGHSHVHVLMMLGMDPIPGVQVTLITRDVETPYSGMLPGHVAGFYSREQCHLDLDRLAVFANARLVHCEATQVDRANKVVRLKGGRPPIPFDVLSINIGSAPQVSSSSHPSDAAGVVVAEDGAAAAAAVGSGGNDAAQEAAVIPVKPIDGFGRRWDLMLERVAKWDFYPKKGANDQQQPRPLRVCVVGGGAGGVELALSMHHRLIGEIAAKQGQTRQASANLVAMTLVTRSPGGVLPTHPKRVSNVFRDVLKERGVKVLCGVEVAGTRLQNDGDGGEGGGGGGGVLLGQGGEVVAAFDECVWCTQGSAAAWVRNSGFTTDERGFLRVNTHLQSTNTPDVFGGGDIVSIEGYERPKAGVFAVMAGMQLSVNLRKRLEGLPLLDEDRYLPQKRFLGLLGTGDGGCVASRGNMALRGRYLWDLKDWIDRKWMHVYTAGLPDLEEMMAAKQLALTGGRPPPLPLVARAAGAEALEALSAAPMRCGGCGAKVGATTLSRAMQKIGPLVVRRPEVVMGVDSPDDCAIVSLPPPPPTAATSNNNYTPYFDNVHTVDFFRSFYEDPYVFGQIAAQHALSDCHAMGAPAISALAMVVLPFGLEDKVGECLHQMMAGACQALGDSNCALVGGHTCEGPEMALGFCVNGAVPTAAAVAAAAAAASSSSGSGGGGGGGNAGLTKGGMRAGDALVLTQGLGTGVLFAARMRNKARGRWITKALKAMTSSNRVAGELALKHGASACTDVTGFGLLGHLVEMCNASAVEAAARTATTIGGGSGGGGEGVSGGGGGVNDRVSGVGALLKLEVIPLLEGAEECVKNKVFSSLHPQNLRLRRAVSLPAATDPNLAHRPAFSLLFDPQTSGGLLVSMPAAGAADFVQALRVSGYGDAAVIGEVVPPLAVDEPSSPVCVGFL